MKSATVKTIHWYGVFAAACGLFAAGICHAVDFPLAGGDLASPTDWNQAVPGSSDDVVLPSSGTYTLGGDVSFKTLFAGSGASNLVFDFTNGNHTVTLYGTTAREVLKPVVNDDGTAVFRGGVWKFNTAASVAMPWKKRAKTVLTDGCVVTNAATFDLGYGATFSRLDVTNGASVYASVFNLNEWGGSSNVLSVTAGGVVSVNGDIRSDVNESTIRVSGNGFLVSGAGSKLVQRNTGAGIRVGYQCSENWLRVEDDGECSDAGELIIGTAANSVRNEVLVRNGGVLSVNKLKFHSCGNRLEVSNATCTVGNNIRLGDDPAVMGNVMRVAGPGATFDWKSNVFGSGCGNLFELADGAVWRLGGVEIQSMMNGGSNNVLRVTGGAVLDNTSDPAGKANFWLNYEKTTWQNNTLEILDGATFAVERLFVHGVGTKIVVSNATLLAKSSDGYGIWLGRAAGATGQKLIVKGTTPRVDLKACDLAEHSTIRFEIPAAGYAEGHVPVTATNLNPRSTETEKFEIECAAWAANPNAVRRLVLMRCSTNISAANAAWVIAQNPNLPNGVRLKVRGGDVILYKPDGLIISYR